MHLSLIILEISVMIDLATPVVTGAVRFNTTGPRIHLLSSYFVRNITDEQLVHPFTAQPNKSAIAVSNLSGKYMRTAPCPNKYACLVTVSQ